jgi:hypothetical protein
MAVMTYETLPNDGPSILRHTVNLMVHLHFLEAAQTCVMMAGAPQNESLSPDTARNESYPVEFRWYVFPSWTMGSNMWHG